MDKKNRQISSGYNGWIQGCDESLMTNLRPMKYFLVIHAELNAILFTTKELDGATLYCTHAPCENCLKHIAQTGIKRIVYKDHEMINRFSKEQLLAIRIILNATHLECWPHSYGNPYKWYISKELEKRGINE